jgi:DNA polymerase
MGAPAVEDPNTAQLRKVAEAVKALEASPLYAYRKAQGYHPVIGEGSHHATIMFIGEAPGEREARTGRPFVGASGRLLDELIASIGLRRADVYITNVVKDRPPENRDPTPEEIALYAPFLQRQIEIIQPQVIATLGRFSMDFILGQFNMPQQGQKISRLHGQTLQAQAPYGPVTVVPLFHPAVGLYNQNQRATLLEDFQALKAFAPPAQT